MVTTAKLNIPRIIESYPGALNVPANKGLKGKRLTYLFLNASIKHYFVESRQKYSQGLAISEKYLV